MLPNKLCYCGSNERFANCCQAIIEQKQYAVTAEQLMRSRFSAFCRQHAEWIQNSWHPSTRPSVIQFDPQQQWLKLQVIASKDIGLEHATVEFEAHYLKAAKVSSIHENSRFEFFQGQWLYVDGDFLKPSFKPYKVSRNDTCPCGSGTKFKNCCQARASI